MWNNNSHFKGKSGWHNLNPVHKCWWGRESKHGQQISVDLGTDQSTNASSVRPSSPYKERTAFNSLGVLIALSAAAARVANEFQQVRTKLGRAKTKCNLSGSQTCLHCQLISQPPAAAPFFAHNWWPPFLSGTPSSAPLNMDRSLLYMSDTGWQKGGLQRSLIPVPLFVLQ